MSVLIVEDHPGSGPAIAAFLDTASYRVTLARSYATGLAALAETPHILIADVGLPGGSGLDLVRLAKLAIPRCFCVLMTADPRDQIRVDALAAGADVFLEKADGLLPALLAILPPPKGALIL